MTVQAPRRSGRMRHQPKRYGLLVTKDDDVLLIKEYEHATYAKAVAGLDSEKWLVAIRSEMESMYTN